MAMTEKPNNGGMIDWGAIAPRPFHKCQGCDKSLGPSDGAWCAECERWERASGKPPLDPDFGDPDVNDIGNSKPNPDRNNF